MADDAASYGSREHLRQRGVRSSETQRSTAGLYQPGQPIGYLSARGTPYEHKFLTKKLGACCLFLAPIILIPVLVITLVPVLQAVANHALHTAQLHVYQANITGITNTSFPIAIEGQAKKVGIFPAHLYFREPVNVYWMTPPPNMRQVHLGSMNLAYIGAAAGHGRIKQATRFNITDEEAFSEFSKFLVTQEEFTWKLKCDNVHAEAFSFFPTYKNFKFSKNVVFKGINNFEDIQILDFQLPGDDPAGGITAQAISSLTNPSPFSVEVGSLYLDLFYKGVYIGPVETHGLNLTSGVNIVQLNGRVIPHQNNETELNLLGELFTAYINGESSPVQAVGRRTVQANGDTIGWLSAGITALVAQVPLKAPQPINPIKGISIEYLSLVYDEKLPYNPQVFSNDLTGQFGLPFGFSVDIVALSNYLVIDYKGALVGTASAPYSNSSTHLDLISAGQTAGNISITLPPTQLKLANETDAARLQLVAFQNAFTFSEAADFKASGAAKAVTDTPLGRVLLDGIKFDVGTGLRGLQGLNHYPTIINHVDVLGGAPDAVSLVVATTVINPSNLNITAGDATFLLQNEVFLGNVTLPNLNLVIGRNDINATSFFDPNRDPKGLETLNRFISGQDTQVNITGFSGSSKVESLVGTFENIRLNATLPGLKTNIAQYANLTVLDTTGIVDNIAGSHVAVNNPFTSGLQLTRISSKVSAAGVFIADIDTPLNFEAAGNAVTTTPNIPLALNLFPPDLFAILRAFVVKSGQDPAPLDGVVQLGGFTYTPTSNADGATAVNKRGESFDFEEENEGAQLLMGVGSNPGALAGAMEAEAAEDHHSNIALRNVVQKRNLYDGFDLPAYVARAFSVAEADLIITSDAVIGEYGTTLTFSQTNVPLGTDETLFKLLPPLALPIVQKVVDESILNVDRVTLLDPQPNSFKAALQGTLTNAGPFDGVVSFPQGLTIFWEGRELAQAAFPNVTLEGDVGAAINVELEAQVSDVGYLTEFTKYLLNNPSFVWNIKGEGIQVSALGIVVPNVTLSKDVQLTGFNGLKGMVIINSFDIPSNDPDGGLHLTAVSTINNPSQVGVQLSSFGTNIMRNGTMIGPAAASEAFTLQALSTTNLPLVGRIQRQDGQDGLAVLSEIFTNFVHNQNTDVQVNGVYAGPSDVVWLNEGIKTLSVMVALPSQDFDVIRLVSLNQLSLFFTEPTAYDPPASTSNTTANFFLPFAFPIDITQVGGNFIANYQNKDTALLAIPQGASQTDVQNRVLTIMFNNVPFAVYDNAHSTFSQFLADTTRQEQNTFRLHGAATGTANTAAGAVTITDIPFDLNTNILGLQNLNARPANVSDLDVVHGYPSYLKITVMVALYNPSDITIGAGDVNFNALFQDNLIGKALINNIVLVPGTNMIPTEIDYMPKGAKNVASGQLLLENYIQNITSTTTVAGTSDTTPIESLKQALGGISLQADIPPLEKLIIVEARLVIPKDIAQTGNADATVMIANPFTASINLLKVKADASYQGIHLATIDQDLSANPIHAPGKTTTTSYPLVAAVDIDPKNLIRFIFAAAAATGTDLGPLPPFFQEVLDLPSTDTTIFAYPDDSTPPCNSGRAFDTLGAILRLLQGLATRIDIESTVKIDDYQTDLDFVQNPVPTDTDDTALYLVGPAGAPLIQLVVDKATLQVDIANATSLTDEGFDVSLKGALLTDAPADAYIEFPQGITVTWASPDGDRDIATVFLPPICSAAGIGVPNLVTSGHLTITNLGAFTDFATYILHNPNFDWILHSNNVTVRALGIKFSNAILTKRITLDAFNNLPGVTITSFDVPSQDNEARALNFVAGSSIPSAASLGIQLDTANFKIYYEGTYLGPAHGDNLFLAAKSVTMVTLYGQITRKSGKDLQTTGALFSDFLQGKNSTLQVTGDSVVTEANGNRPVGWLTKAFKTLTIDVILPGHIYQIIYSITLSDLTATIKDPNSSYDFPVSNNKTTAVFSNPFGFDLQPIKAGPSITITYENVDAAQLDLPLANVDSAGTSNGPQDFEDLVLSFKNKILHALDHGAFQRFLAKLTDTNDVTFGLKGGADVVARTIIGDVPISGIPFNVTSSLDGINSFNHEAKVENPVPRSATQDFISIPATVTLENPSDVTLFTTDLSLPVIYQDYEIGRAIIPDLGLIPGTNIIQADVHYQPADKNSTKAQDLLTKYLQPVDGQPQSANLVIDGSSKANPAPLSPYDSINPALEGVAINTILQGIGASLYVSVEVLIDGTQLCAGENGNPEVSTYITARNPLPVELAFLSAGATIQKAGSNVSPPYAMLTVTLDPIFVMPAAADLFQDGGKTYTTQKIEHVLLPRGLLASLDILGSPVDIYSYIQTRVGGPSGYIVPSVRFDQKNVPATYTVSLFGETITDVLTAQALLDLINGNLLKQGVEGTADLLKCVLPILQGGGLLGGIQSSLCALTGSNADTGLLGGLLGNVPVLGPVLQGLGCGPSSSTSVASSTSSSASNPLGSVLSGAGGAVSSVLNPITSPLAPVTSALAPVGSAVSGIGNGLGSVLGVGGDSNSQSGDERLGSSSANSRRSEPTPVARGFKDL